MIEDLRSIEPSWKGMEPPPTRLATERSDEFRPANYPPATMQEALISNLEEPPLPDLGERFPDERTHPWKVSVNSDGTVNVSAGFLLHPDIAYADGTGAAWPHDSSLIPLEFLGVENRDLDGYIYAKCPVESFAFFTTTAGGSNASYLVYPTSIEIVGSAALIDRATAEEDTMHVLIAKIVDKEVVAQYLQHNPTVGYTYTDA